MEHLTKSHFSQSSSASTQPILLITEDEVVDESTGDVVRWITLNNPAKR